MKSLLNFIDTNNNFWEVNPHFLSVGTFKGFYEKDSSKGKGFTSRIMWGIALYIDQAKDNLYRNLSDEEKKELLRTDVIGNRKFVWEDYQYLIDEYLKRIVSIAEKKLFEFLNKLEERSIFINKTIYSMDEYDAKGNLKKGTADQLDKMMANTKKLYDLYFEIEKEFKESSNEGSVKGDRIESASEKGLL